MNGKKTVGVSCVLLFGFLYLFVGSGGFAAEQNSTGYTISTDKTSRANLIWATDSSGDTNDTVYVDVMIQNDTAFTAFTFEISYCVEMLTYESTVRGTIDPGWVLFSGSETPRDTIRVGGFAMNPIPSGSNGSIARLEFTVTCGSCSNGETCVMEFTLLSDGLAGFSASSGTFTYTGFGIPTETPTVVPTETPTITPTEIPSSTPTTTPTTTPTETPTETPTGTPTRTPTGTPSSTPTVTPTSIPTDTATNTPTITPSATSSGPTATPLPVPATGSAGIAVLILILSICISIRSLRR
ncbi:hypothetical protein JW979_10585 [bacterium]|nr:hypothetical protein [candidate division CSSED10-310 bacterium]